MTAEVTADIDDSMKQKRIRYHVDTKCSDLLKPTKVEPKNCPFKLRVDRAKHCIARYWEVVGGLVNGNMFQP